MRQMLLGIRKKIYKKGLHDAIQEGTCWLRAGTSYAVDGCDADAAQPCNKAKYNVKEMGSKLLFMGTYIQVHIITAFVYVCNAYH